MGVYCGKNSFSKFNWVKYPTEPLKVSDKLSHLCPLYTNPCKCPTKLGMVAVICISSSAWKSPPRCNERTSSVLCLPKIVSAAQIENKVFRIETR